MGFLATLSRKKERKDDRTLDDYLPSQLSHPNIDLNSSLPVARVESTWHEITIGETAQGEPLQINLPTASNVRITGDFGVGKTTLLNIFRLHAFYHSPLLKTAIINIREPEIILIPHKVSAQCYGYASTFPEAVELLDNLNNIIRDRIKNKPEKTVWQPTPAEPAILLMVDNLNETLKTAFKVSPPGPQLTAEALFDSLLANNGKDVGVYIITTQNRLNLNSNYRTPILQSQYKTLIHLGPANKEEISEMAIGSQAAMLTPNITGRGLLRFNNNITAFQSYHVPYETAQAV